ncbi:MAG TPA: M23 family metallopeptidase [Kouleothrix sp.]|uniref:M23 family metallopeptidase n=1 Tax=Kouleothrix sp. TaxID=2779161 RepID=UPI002D005B22|nr:M23 family metallopeptidase [Kouleothrix sp.]
MINDGWAAAGGLRKVIFILALVGLAYLLLQTRPGAARISAWNAGGAAGARTQGITGEAAPLTGRGVPDTDLPSINPLGLPNTVMTQGYGVGSHAPANIWGAIDLAIDGNHDGQADPDGTLGTPVYATHDGVVHLARDTWPAGNHIWLEGIHFKTGYSHLKDFAIQDGQTVKRGDVIGYVGSTGEASGPHLDYQVWKDGVNVNPLDYNALP